jgi:hypothetical protein
MLKNNNKQMFVRFISDCIWQVVFLFRRAGYVRNLRQAVARDKSRKLVLVGNSTTLLTKQLGNQIDSCERVVRFNYFELSGYGQSVGNKCTDWALWLNDGLYEKLTVTHPDFLQARLAGGDTIWLLPTMGKRFFELLAAFTKHTGRAIESMHEVDSSAFYEGIMILGGYIPTTGFMMILTMLSHYPEHTICIAGIAELEKNEGKHYFLPEHRAWHRHHFGRERIVIEYLLKNNIIQRLK